MCALCCVVVIRSVEGASGRLVSLRDDFDRAPDQDALNLIGKRFVTLVESTQRDCVNCKTLLDTWRADNLKFEQSHHDAESSALVEMRRNLYNLTVRKYADSLSKFNLEVAAYETNVKSQQKRRLKQVDTAKLLDDQKIDELVETGMAEQFLSDSLMSDDLRDCITAIEQRHTQVLQLEKSIRELLELFRDLGKLVDYQQESLNIIEKHIDKAKDYTEKGAQELKEAEDYQKSARKRACCLLVLIMSILTIVILPTVYSVSNKA